MTRIHFLFFIPYSLFDQIVAIPYLPRLKNKEYNYISIPYSLLFIWPNRDYSLFAQIRNNEWNSTSFSYLIESILIIIHQNTDKGQKWRVYALFFIL